MSIKSKFIILLLVCMVIILSIIFRYNYADKVNKTRIEEYMSSRYTPTKRQALFEIALDKNHSYFLNALSNELYIMMIAMQNRLYMHSDEMANKWHVLMSEEKMNITEIATNDVFLNQSVAFFYYLSQYDSLTDAEKDIMCKIHSVWSIMDDFIIEQKLNNAILMRRYKKAEIINSSVDDLAEHGFTLIKNLSQIPRSLCCFIQNEIAKIEVVNNNGFIITIHDKKTIQELAYMLRNCKFQRTRDNSSNPMDCQIKIYEIEYKHKPLCLKLYSDYINISCAHSTYEYEKLMENEALWDEWGHNTNLNGNYLVDSQMIEALYQWIMNIKAS